MDGFGGKRCRMENLVIPAKAGIQESGSEVLIVLRTAL